MSVYIKGMEMPNLCMDCFGFNHEYHFCSVTDKDVDCALPDWCPLVEVSPHGRLGDLDKLEKMFADIDSAPYSCFDGEKPFYSAEDAAQIIRLAPTIIPAEGEEET